MDSLKVTAVKKNQSNDRTEMTVAGNELRVKRRDGSRGWQLTSLSSLEVVLLSANVVESDELAMKPVMGSEARARRRNQCQLGEEK